MRLRKVLKNRGHFPSDEAATKLIYLALRNITKKWKKPPVTWKLAATQFAIQFGERLSWKDQKVFPTGSLALLGHLDPLDLSFVRADTSPHGTESTTLTVN
jgi:putative transposase